MNIFIHLTRTFLIVFQTRGRNIHLKKRFVKSAINTPECRSRNAMQIQAEQKYFSVNFISDKNLWNAKYIIKRSFNFSSQSSELDQNMSEWARRQDLQTLKCSAHEKCWYRARWERKVFSNWILSWAQTNDKFLTLSSWKHFQVKYNWWWRTPAQNDNGAELTSMTSVQMFSGNRIYPT